MKNFVKSAILMTVNTLLILLAVVFIFELAGSYLYDKWKEEFKQSDQFYGMLTTESDNEILLWEYRPNFAGEYAGIPIVTNSHGFRDVEHSLAKPEDAYRVVFAGDSVTVGIGVEYEDTFVHRFQEIVDTRSQSVRIEAISASVDGYSGEQVMELIRERAAVFSPDTVVYVLCMNDFDFLRSSGQKHKYFKKPDSFFMRVLRRAYTGFLGGDYYEETFKENGQIVISDIVRTKRELANIGSDFIVVIMPILKTEESYLDYPLAWLHKEIASRLQQEEVPVIDLWPDLSESSKLIELGIDQVHLNRQGHEEVARLLAEKIS